MQRVKMVRVIFVLGLSIAVASSAFASDRAITKIAFGSCARQMQELPIFDTIVEADPDLFLMIGDAIYPDRDDKTEKSIKPWPNERTVERMKAAYLRLAARPGFQNLQRNVPIMAVWDDHDYGINDGAADFPLKDISRQLFLDFFAEPADSERRRSPGLYDAKIIAAGDKRVQIILLDTRYFRSRPTRDTRTEEEKEALNIKGKYAPDFDPEKTILGEAQWRWLEQQLLKPAEIRLLVSSFPFVAHELGADAWGNFPLERQKLFELIEQTRAGGIIVLSGDVHFSEISKTDEGPYPIYEFTSSPLSNISTSRYRYRNSYRISTAHTGSSFGLIEIDWQSAAHPRVTLKAIDVEGQVVIQQQIDSGGLVIR